MDTESTGATGSTGSAVRGGYPRGDLRVSDADRDRAIAELSEAFQAGRLTTEEFEERSGEALRARTGRDIARLLADLPRNPASAAAPAQGAGPAEPSPRPPGFAVVPRIMLAVPVIVLLVIAAIASGQHGHHHAFGVFPVLAALLLIARLARGGGRGRRF